MIIVYVFGLIVPWIFYLIDLIGNNFDAWFSDSTLQKLKVKDNSFLRKVIPLKEGDIIKNGRVCGHRYYLLPRVLALFIQSIILLLGLILLIIHLVFVSFMSSLFITIVGCVLLAIWVLYTFTMSILSQGLEI